jgi:hypothetical protein
MTEAAEKAIKTLVEIAENTEVEPDTRIRAACSILNFEKTPEATHEGEE